MFYSCFITRIYIVFRPPRGHPILPYPALEHAPGLAFARRISNRNVLPWTMHLRLPFEHCFVTVRQHVLAIQFSSLSLYILASPNRYVPPWSMPPPLSVYIKRSSEWQLRFLFRLTESIKQHFVQSSIDKLTQ